MKGLGQKVVLGMNGVELGRIGPIFGQNRSSQVWEAYGNPPGAQKGNKKSKIENSSKIAEFRIFPANGQNCVTKKVSMIFHLTIRMPLALTF